MTGWPALSVSAERGPDRVVVRQLHLSRRARRSSRTARSTAASSERGSSRRTCGEFGCQRLAVVGQHQVVEPRAQQADRAAHARRGDLHPRHVPWAPSAAAAAPAPATLAPASAAASASVFAVLAICCRRRRRRLRQMRRDQQLEAQQDRDRDRDRQEQPLLVHQCPVRQSQARAPDRSRPHARDCSAGCAAPRAPLPRSAPWPRNASIA